jgi:dCTP diphosphatase
MRVGHGLVPESIVKRVTHFASQHARNRRHGGGDLMNSSFGRLRDSLRLFVQERDWQQFHTPRNVALALAGECGELCAIFQWKDDGENVIKDLTRAELVHLGEEIADVFVYNTRLADLTGIDLAQATKAVLFHPDSLSNATDLTFPDALGFIKDSESSPRDLLFQMNSSLGKLSDLFASNGPSAPAHTSPLQDWSRKDVQALSTHLSTIAIVMLRLSLVAGLTMTEILDDKIAKNAAKYPAALVRGSSKKYTAYRFSLWRRLFIPFASWPSLSLPFRVLLGSFCLTGALWVGLVASALETITVEV